MPIKCWNDHVTIEPEAFNQLKNVASLPFIHHHVAVMPDAHAGKGATVGAVIATRGAIIPAAVGVDIGCGMGALQTNLTAAELPDSLLALRLELEQWIPVGGESHKKEIPKFSLDCWQHTLQHQFAHITQKHPGFASTKTSPVAQLGTLGGGNHFIELCVDENDGVWILFHSGSRNIGNKIGNYFIAKAKEEMQKYFIHLPDLDLAYLVEGSTLFDDYIEAVSWAQEYATANRKAILNQIMLVLERHFPHLHTNNMVVSCHHNYIAREHHFNQNVWVTRKGAVRARVGDMGIIPGSMGTKSYITMGKGNADSFHSSSHGAGRAMSRTAARKTFTLDAHAAAVAGVECRMDAGVIDETPMAYKDIDAVMASQQDLVEITHTLKQVLCIKG